jgi:multiple sugar transport system permease protein
VFTFLTAWSDFMWPLVVLTDESKYTLPVAIANLSGEHVQDIELMMAGAVVTVLPALALFLALQRYYVRGILMGGVKE